MRISYDPKTDMLYIHLVEKPGVDSDEVSPGIVIDFDENQQVVGMEIEDASKVTDLSSFAVNMIPAVPVQED
ncbi:MAG: DUF2283 domain-containing protein [Dehalococcoidia bacterium]